jgi:hypothetical protein
MEADNPREQVLTSGRPAELSGNGEILDGVPPTVLVTVHDSAGDSASVQTSFLCD